jgi:hypothetical protein
MMMARDMGEPMRRATLRELTLLAMTGEPLPVMQDVDRQLAVRMRAAFTWAMEAELVTRDRLHHLDAVQVNALVLRFMQARAAAPGSCGPEIIPAPARGPMVAFTPISAVTPGGEIFGKDDDWQFHHSGWEGRDAARAATAFDVMERQAKKAAARAKVAYVPAFSQVQIQTAGRYAMLVERHEAAGVRCSSIEAMPQGGGGSAGSFIDAVIHEGEIIRAMRCAIGDGIALAVRRVRPSRRGTKAGIRDRALVDAVCLEGKSLSEVLDRHGWSDFGGNIDAVRASLRAALDRMAMASSSRRQKVA